VAIATPPDFIGSSVADSLSGVAPWLGGLLLVGLSSARFAFAFLLVPIFSQQVMPATVRNSIIVTFGLVAYILQTQFLPTDLSAFEWFILFFREAAAGTIIGFFFGSIFWALSAAGEVIDAKTGATIGQLVDPFSGQQTSLTAILLGRFAQVIFVAVGGLTLLIGTIMESYVIWPMGLGGLRFDPASVALFEGEFGRMFLMTFLFSAPIIIILYVVDAGLGLLNRFAQQFNVFSLSMPIKSVAATFIIILCLPLFVRSITSDIASRTAVAAEVLGRVAAPDNSSNGNMR
jgi:type III secretion protein T